MNVKCPRCGTLVRTVSGWDPVCQNCGYAGGADTTNKGNDGDRLLLANFQSLAGFNEAFSRAWLVSGHEKLQVSLIELEIRRILNESFGFPPEALARSYTHPAFDAAIRAKAQQLLVAIGEAEDEEVERLLTAAQLWMSEHGIRRLNRTQTEQFLKESNAQLSRQGARKLRGRL
jgi:hypothetical protein